MLGLFYDIADHKIPRESHRDSRVVLRKLCLRNLDRNLGSVTGLSYQVSEAFRHEEQIPTWIQPSPEKGRAPHSSILAWSVLTGGRSLQATTRGVAQELDTTE